MLERRYSKKSRRPSSEDIIGVQDILLEHVLTRKWKDYEQFARTLSLKLLTARPRNSDELSDLVFSISHPFFRFNNIHKREFLHGIPARALLARIEAPASPPRESAFHKKRLQIGAKLRILILERDQFKCKLCGRTAKDTTLEVDHIVPVARGGKNSLDNLQTVCFDCNRGKSDLTLNIPKS